MKIIALLGAFVVIGVLLTHDSKKPPEPKAAKPTATMEAIPPTAMIGWNVADHLMRNRGRYRAALSGQNLPEWSKYTAEYFRSLKARRDSAIAWTRLRDPHPVIVFLGQFHVNTAGGNTPERIREIDALQTRLFETLRVESVDAQVIAIEEEGCAANEVVTPAVFTRIAKESIKDVTGREFSDAQVSEMMRGDRQASTRAVTELRIPVTCGEEWPNRMETRLLTMASADPVQDTVRRELIAAFNRLRSEIILIRTLEFLREKRGAKGVIIQGDFHRADIEELAPEYGISLRSIAPR